MAHGIEIIERTFIQTEPVTFSYPENEEVDYFVFTSSNAVKIILNSGIALQSKKIACTSGETKRVLLDHHIPVTLEADDARSLADKLVQAQSQSVVFFCGNIHRDELPETLKAAGIKVEEVIVYQTNLTPVLVNNFINAILFFSPSAVDSFFINNTLPPITVCFCIGQTTANHLASKTKAPIHIAPSSSQEKLIDQLINYYTHQVHVEK